MNDKTIEILIFLLGYLKEKNFDEESLSEFSEHLVVSGDSENDVAEALGILFDRFNHAPAKTDDMLEHKAGSVRILNDMERINISPGIFGYILKLRSLSLINSSQMERILDYCMFNDSERMTEADIDEIVAEIIFDDHMKQTGREF